ncbi:hypothetical protein DFH28DRAFT_973267, partial [Melampsora americana]
IFVTIFFTLRLLLSLCSISISFIQADYLNFTGDYHHKLTQTLIPPVPCPLDGLLCQTPAPFQLIFTLNVKKPLHHHQLQLIPSGISCIP